MINKCITDEDIYGGMRQAIELGWKSVKLYFMIGLPTETFEDLDGIAKIAENIMKIYYEYNGGRKGGKFQVNVSVSNFVPKPHTPFQWVAQDSPEQFGEKHQYLKEKFKKIKAPSSAITVQEPAELKPYWPEGTDDWPVPFIMPGNPGKFDGWNEHFNYDKWIEVLIADSILFLYFGPGFRRGCASMGSYRQRVDNAYLAANGKGFSAEQTPDCRMGCTVVA